eukprot:PITA_31586
MLKKNSDVFTVFKQFKALVENITGRIIKCLRTDNGDEFTSKEFDNYCKDARIERHKTTVYTPQQNRVVERMNMALLERARSMLSNTNLQKELWTEAVSTTCYLINRSPSIAIGCKIPQEGYRLWDPTTDKIIINRDVKFNESSLENPDVDDKLKHDNVSKLQHIQFETSSNTDDSQDEQVSDADHEEVPTDNNHQIVEVPEISLRRSTRIKRPPKRYDDYVTSIALNANDDEPLCYQEAVEGSKSEKWKESMKDEMMALVKNGTWDLVEFPKDRKIVGCKWVYKLKRGVDDTEERYKARLVAKCFSQKAGIDF